MGIEEIVEILIDCYTLEDLHMNRVLIDEVELGLEHYVKHNKDMVLAMLEEDGHLG